MAGAYLIHVDPAAGYGDVDGMARYASSVGAIVESFGGVYRTRHKAVCVLEGPWAPEFITLIEFPSMNMLREFYDSDQYRPWLELRKNAGDGSLVIFEGSRSPDDFDL
jgi:uncharacterized protein (DUF1330 family)